MGPTGSSRATTPQHLRAGKEATAPPVTIHFGSSDVARQGGLHLEKVVGFQEILRREWVGGRV